MKALFDPILNKLRRDDLETAKQDILNNITLLTGTSTLNFPDTATGLSADLTMTVSGAVVGDYVVIAPPTGSILANTSYTGWVSASNTVTVRLNNYSAGSANPSSGSFKALVFHNN